MIRPPIHAQHVLPLPQGERDLPSLEDTFETWLATGTTEAGNTLHLREHALGAATLSGTSLRLIYEIANRQIETLRDREHISARLRHPLHQRIVRHEATLSASETQSVLPQGVLVQKTVSLQMGEKLIVCSCVGDERLERQHLRDIASALALPRRAVGHCTINPHRLDPVVVFGMAAGMISPFFPPRRQTRVDALVLLPWPPEWEDQQREVAISLSLWESLLLPLVCLTSLVRCYAAASYPHIPLIELPGKPNPQAGSTSALPPCAPRAPPAETKPARLSACCTQTSSERNCSPKTVARPTHDEQIHPLPPIIIKETLAGTRTWRLRHSRSLSMHRHEAHLAHADAHLDDEVRSPPCSLRWQRLQRRCHSLSEEGSEGEAGLR